MSGYKGPVCRGSWQLGNNCRICERCIETRPIAPMTHELVERLRYTHEHGLFDANVAGMLAAPNEAADRIEALEAQAVQMREALERIRAISSKPTYPGNNCRDIDDIARQAIAALEQR